MCVDERQGVEENLCLRVLERSLCVYMCVCLPGLIAVVVCSTLGTVGVTVSGTVVVSVNTEKNKTLKVRIE